jgi:hypothetical protein
MEPPQIAVSTRRLLSGLESRCTRMNICRRLQARNCPSLSGH